MLSNDEFQSKLKELNNGIKTDTIYFDNNTIMDCTCKFGHKFKSKAKNLIYNKSGCPVCSGRYVNIGFNDMWTSNPEQAKLLLYPEDGYKYTQCSGQIVWWKCPCCGEHLHKRISNVNRKGLSCNKCSDGISFPNRFMYNLLKLLNENFEAEYIIEGAKYRYDFYIPRYKLIIEMQGRQHYEGWNNLGNTKEEIQKNDSRKKDYALKNGIEKYVEIDCREANKNHIKNSILNSELINLYNFDDIDWNSCSLNSVKSFIGLVAEYYNNNISTIEISRKTGFSLSTITRWLKIANELKLCNWIPSNGFLNDEKPVILLNTGKIYDSISNASKDIGQCVQNISEACYGKRSYCGTINNIPLVWMFLEDYTNPTVPNKVLNVYTSHHSGIGVNQYSIEGKFIRSFNSIKEAKQITGITSIINVCSKKKYEAGNFRWYYIDDLNQPDKTKIIGIPRDYGKDKVYAEKVKKAKQRLNNENKKVIIDCYDRYGNFITTYTGYNEIAVKLNINKQQIYKSCVGKCAYVDKFVFRYHNEGFYKYYYPMEFKNYINVYTKDTNNFVGTYYSLQEATRQLKISGTSSAYKALRKERKYAYGYQFFYASDPSQPDKSKIIPNNQNNIFKEVS